MKFTVVAGGGSVSPEEAVTDGSGRVETFATPGPIFGFNAVLVAGHGG